jgi:hypothetical protein
VQKNRIICVLFFYKKNDNFEPFEDEKSHFELFILYFKVEILTTIYRVQIKTWQMHLFDLRIEMIDF